MKKINGFFFPEWDNHFVNYFNDKIGYQEPQRNRALSYVKDFIVAVDCGAHVGLWSKDIVNFFETTYCFEPVPEYFECLKANIKQKNSILINKGLGKENSNAKIFIPFNSGNSGNAKIIDSKDKNKYLENSLVDIQIMKLDKLKLKKIDFLKIDVEGFGLSVLEGMVETLNKCNPVICLEMFNEKDNNLQLDLLHSLGYKLVDKIIKEHVFIKVKI